MAIRRREFLRYGVGTAAALLGSHWLAPEGTFAQTPTATYGAVANVEGFMFAARDWTAKYQLRTSTQWFSTGGEANDSLIAGKIDATTVGAGPLVALSAAMPDRFTQVMVWSYGDYSHTLVRPDSPYRSMSDLRGKKMGVTVGSGAYMAWLVYLDANGFRPDEFQVAHIGGPDLAAALAGKVIDAATVWEPFVSLMEYKGLGRVVASFGKWVYDLAVMHVRTDAVRQRRSTIVRLVAGALDAQAFIAKHPNEAAKLVSARMAQQGVDIPPQAFENMIKQRLIWQPDFTPTVKESLAKFGQVALKLGRIKQLPKFRFAEDILNEAKAMRG